MGCQIIYIIWHQLKHMAHWFASALVVSSSFIQLILQPTPSLPLGNTMLSADTGGVDVTAAEQCAQMHNLACTRRRHGQSCWQGSSRDMPKQCGGPPAVAQACLVLSWRKWRMRPAAQPTVRTCVHCAECAKPVECLSQARLLQEGAKRTESRTLIRLGRYEQLELATRPLHPAALPSWPTLPPAGGARQSVSEGQVRLRSCTC